MFQGTSGGSRGAGGRPSGDRGGGRQERFDQMSKQQQLIAQKKAEIEAKLEAERLKAAAVAAVVGDPGIGNTIAIGGTPTGINQSQSPTAAAPIVPAAAADVKPIIPKLVFSNDGSFLEQFKRLQEEQQKQKELMELSNPNQVEVKIKKEPLLPLPDVEPNLEYVPKPHAQATGIPSPMFYEDPYAPPPPPPPPVPPVMSTPTPSAFTQFHHPHPQDLDLLEPPPPPPPIVTTTTTNQNEGNNGNANTPTPIGFPSQAVKNLAAEVAENGDQFEEMTRSTKKNDPLLWFLHRPDSEEYRRYRDLVLKIRNDLRSIPVAVSQSPHPPSNMNPLKRSAPPTPVPSSAAIKVEETDEEAASRAREAKRRSRWGPQSETAKLPVPTIVVPNATMVVSPTLPTIVGPGPSGGPKSGSTMLSQVTRTNPQLLAYARQAYGTVNLDDEQWKQCEEAYKMNLLFQDIARKKARDDKLAQAGKHKHEYDSDEEVDEDLGTWEHKKRLMEMEKTKEWAQELTKKAQGKHHIGDFLPPEELAKFMDKYKAVKEGKQMTDSAYEDFKIAQDNVGFKLLQKMGWTDGQALGASGQGITAPIQNTSNAVENAGLGLEVPTELKDDDDEYSAYRKRMMLAYRFRPNPLNNPRRAYY